MELKIFVSLALCTLVSGRPGFKTNDGLQNALSNLQLLIPRIIEDTLAEDDGIRQSMSNSHQHHADFQESYLVPKLPVSYLVPNTQSAYLVPSGHASEHESHLVPNSLESYLLANSQGSYSVPKAHAPDSHESHLVPDSHESYPVANSQGSYLLPRAHATRPKPNGPQYYPDGAFSDIPNAAFTLDEQLTGHHEVTKKDMSHSRRPHRNLHLSNNDNFLTNNLKNICLDLFRGKSQVRANSLEVMLNVCGELLDLEGIEIFEPRDDNNRNLFDLNGLVGVGCCAPAQHNDAGQGGHRHQDEMSPVLDFLKAIVNAEADNSVSDEDRGDEVNNLAGIVRLFRPLGSGRE